MDIRQKVYVELWLVLSHCKKFEELPLMDRWRICRNIERSCYAYTFNRAVAENLKLAWNCNAFITIYATLVARVLANLDVTGSIGNQELILRVLDGFYDVGKLSSQEMMPSKTQALRDEINTRNNVKLQKYYSVIISCAFCGQKKIITQEKQFRSGDEPKGMLRICDNPGCEKVSRGSY